MGVNKKEKEIEKIEIESIKEKDDDICSEVENAKEEITTKEDQMAEIHKNEKDKEEVALDIIKDKEDDQSSLKMEEKEDNICSEVENTKEEITTKEDQIAEIDKEEKKKEKIKIE